jgi:sulfite reductase alpha subunit-like flavoprotein
LALTPSCSVTQVAWQPQPSGAVLAGVGGAVCDTLVLWTVPEEMRAVGVTAEQRLVRAAEVARAAEDRMADVAVFSARAAEQAALVAEEAALALEEAALVAEVAAAAERAAEQVSWARNRATLSTSYTGSNRVRTRREKQHLSVLLLQ